MIVHLVSAQTLPNLLPLLGTEPTRVLQVGSGNPQFRKQAECLRQTMVGYYHWPEAFITDAFTEQPSPGIEETICFLESIHREEPIRCINFTGGTKLMSLGAYEFAKKHEIPSFYADTADRRSWVDGNTSPEPAGFEPMEACVERLSVPAVLCAYGLSQDAFKDDRISEDKMQFGRKLYELYRSHNELEKNPLHRYLSVCRERLFRGSAMLDRGKLREALANGLPTPEDEPSTRMLDAAKDAGLVHAMGDRYFLHPAPAFTGVNSKQIRKVANQAWRTLEGGWWELAVLDMMYRSGRFQDIRWSVESGSGGPSQAFGENDIVAIDRQRLALVFVSCKASDSFLTKPLEHVFATRERATRYGGTFAHVAFAFFESRKPQVRQTFQNACTTVGARFLPSADDVAEWLALSLTSGGRPGA